jgi:hypothetical protein
MDLLEFFTLGSLILAIIWPLVLVIGGIVTIISIILYVYYLIKGIFSKQETKHCEFKLERAKDLKK